MLLRLLVVLISYGSYVWFFYCWGGGVAPSAPPPGSVPARWPSQHLVVHVSCTVNTAPWKIFVKIFSYIMEPKTQSPILNQTKSSLSFLKLRNQTPTKVTKYVQINYSCNS